MMDATNILRQEVTVNLVIAHEEHKELMDAYMNQKLISLPTLQGRFAVVSVDLTSSFTFDVNLVKIG